MEGTKQGFGCLENKGLFWVEREKRSSAGGSLHLSKGGSLHLRLQPPQPFSGKPGTARAAEKIRLLHLLMN